MISHFFLNVVLTFINGASPHYFQLEFFISVFPKTFCIPTHIFQLHKINSVTEGSFKEERKILFLDSSNLDVLRKLVISQFLHQNERRRKSGKNKCIVEQYFPSVKEQKFSGLNDTQRLKDASPYSLQSGNFLFFTPDLLSHLNTYFTLKNLEVIEMHFFAPNLGCPMNLILLQEPFLEWSNRRKKAKCLILHSAYTLLSTQIVLLVFFEHPLIQVQIHYLHTQ